MMQRSFIFLCLCLSLSFVVPTLAQSISVHVQPDLVVDDQVVRDAQVLVHKVISDGPGWVVIYGVRQSGRNEVVGWAHVDFGVTKNLFVPINDTRATWTLFAVLHKDDGQSGVFEYDGKSGIDNPVSFNGLDVSQLFDVTIIDVPNQFAVENHQVAVKTVVAQGAGGVGVYAYSNGQCATPLGWQTISAGTTSNLEVPLRYQSSLQLTKLCVSVENSSGVPEVIGAQTATTVIETVPTLDIPYQVVTPGDGQPPIPPKFLIDAALSDGAGIITFQPIVNGVAGAVLPTTLSVDGGLSQDLVVSLARLSKPARLADQQKSGSQDLSVTFPPAEAAQLTATLLVTLNFDKGTPGVFDSGTDTPQGPRHVAQFVVPIAPWIGAIDQTPAVGTAPGTVLIQAPTVLIDQAGLLAAFNSKGDLLGTVPVHPGDNPNVAVQVDKQSAGTQVQLKLFYDQPLDDQLGVGVDPQVMVGGQPVQTTIKLTQASSP